MDFTISYNPTEKEFKLLLNWLYKESEYDSESSYFNLKDGDYFNRKSLIIIKNSDDFPIGFITFSLNEKILSINNLGIKREFRNQNLGKLFTKKVLFYFRKKGVLVVDLFCRPTSSYKFWKKLNFLDFPENLNVPTFSMYKPLIDTFKPQNESFNLINEIQIWNVEDYRADRFNPKFFFSFKELEKPIVIPVNRDWRINFSKENKKIYSGRIKNANFIKREVYKYLILEKIE